MNIVRQSSTNVIGKKKTGGFWVEPMGYETRSDESGNNVFYDGVLHKQQVRKRSLVFKGIMR